MKFLDPGSLPADLCGGRIGAVQRSATISWLDPSKLPPLPIGDGWIDAETALTIAHDLPKFRAALKKHSQPEALDRFAAEFCRQLPNSESLYVRYMGWRLIADDLGGPETAKVLATAIASRTVTPMLRHGAAYSLAAIGDKTHLPAMAIAMLRMEEGFNRKCVQQQFATLVQRLGLSAAEVEDWALPDEGDLAENSMLRSGQAARLEQAMLNGRRWTVQTFDRRIARQAVMAPLAAGLVWGYFDDAGRLVEAFTIGPDAAYPAPHAGVSVGIVHPSHLPAGEVARWREQTRNLHVPFAQWSLSARVLSAEEIAADRISQLPGIQMPAATLLCRLEGLGWRRPKSRKRLEFHTRAFADLGVTAVIRYSGIPLTYGGEWSDQSILDCTFEKDGQQLPLSRVSPIAISAVLDDLDALGKAGGRKR